MTTKRPVRSVLIANRGEIAVRIIRTCRELGLRTIAVYSDADRTMPHVLMADEAYRLGPPPSRESYLLMDSVIGIARRAGADAIHPGYGFLSENATFAARVQDAGCIWIGPPASAIRAMGDKTAARTLMMQAGVPTVPGTDGPVATLEEATAFCDRAGFPVLIKAAAGGGGKGMRVVRTSAEIAPFLEQARSEARSSFGDERVYIERYLDEPRHIEFQILADAYGHVIHLGERECSIQRRHQKVVEESPSVLLDEDLRQMMGAMAVKAARACGYVNAGTIEFLVDKERRFYFLEMNTRLQVEHPVTELRTGLDLVKLQLEIAADEPLPMTQEQVRFTGHAIECRICAEDPQNGFLPSTGRLTKLRTPGGPGIREDRGIAEGDEVSMYYDPMIAKLITWAPDRTAAMDRMLRALSEYVVEGVATNIGVCDFVLRHSTFRAGSFDTGFLPRWYQPGKMSNPSDDACDTAMALLGAWLECEHSEGQKNATPSFDAKATGDGVASNGWKAGRLRAMRGGAT
jgi:acetyl-CoA carboxylase, biotin carboxylase subunit